MSFMFYVIQCVFVYVDHTTGNWWEDLGTVLHTVRGVWGLGIRMMTHSDDLLDWTILIFEW